MSHGWLFFVLLNSLAHPISLPASGLSVAGPPRRAPVVSRFHHCQFSGERRPQPVRTTLSRRESREFLVGYTAPAMYTKDGSRYENCIHHW